MRKFSMDVFQRCYIHFSNRAWLTDCKQTRRHTTLQSVWVSGFKCNHKLIQDLNSLFIYFRPNYTRKLHSLHLDSCEIQLQNHEFKWVYVDINTMLKMRLCAGLRTAFLHTIHTLNITKSWSCFGSKVKVKFIKSSISLARINPPYH